MSMSAILQRLQTLWDRLVAVKCYIMPAWYEGAIQVTPSVFVFCVLKVTFKSGQRVGFRSTCHIVGWGILSLVQSHSDAVCTEVLKLAVGLPAHSPLPSPSLGTENRLTEFFCGSPPQTKLNLTGFEIYIWVRLHAATCVCSRDQN